jgi:catechol 2,3-dioxygenase-like lactoylglutathione lyase family enzyme
MSRIQLALNVSDLDGAIAFYSRLLSAEPAKVRPGYANFAVADPPLKLVLLERPGAEERLNHLGVEVESSEEVVAADARLRAAGEQPDPEMGVSCCHALQDKVWLTDPDGARWEIYTVLADAEAPAGCCDPVPVTR